MNRAQRVAWFNLVGGFTSMTLIGLWGYFLLSGPTAEKFHVIRQLVMVFSGIMVLFFILFLALILRKKQGATEPDMDERDRHISRKAVLVTFVATCLLLFLAAALPMWACGLDSSIPVVALSLINLGVFLGALVVYNAAVLILYRVEGGAQ